NGLGDAPSGPSAVPIHSIADELIGEWLDDEVLAHCPIVQAAEASQQSAPETPLQLPEDWAGLASIFGKLGYHLDSKDRWRALGYAMYEGPEPSVQLNASRLRTVTYHCSLACTIGGWDPADVRKARAVTDRITQDASRCEEDLPKVLRARRKIKVSALPLCKELGQDGLKLLVNTKAFADEPYYTQWSNILATNPAPNIVPTSRNIAAMAEKVDDRVWEELKGMVVTMWAPSDFNALTRLLASLIRVMPFNTALPELEAVSGTTVDMLAANMPTFYAIMQKPLWSNILCRPPNRSNGSTKDLPRVTVDLLFHEGVDQFAQILQLQHLRCTVFPENSFLAAR
ncbi:unnamed protein product, partial [Prorocentrum cordatum]